MEFNAESVVAYLEQEYDLTFTRVDERYYQAIYDNNGKQYVSVYTNSYDYLKKAYKPKKYEQMTLF